LEERRISAKSITEKMGISRERVVSTIYEDFDMLVACFLPGRAKENISWGKGGVTAVDVKGHKEKATLLCLQQ
jgi:hypothetical protein